MLGNEENNLNSIQSSFPIILNLPQPEDELFTSDQEEQDLKEDPFAKKMIVEVTGKSSNSNTSQSIVQLKRIQNSLKESIFSKTSANVFIAGGYIARKITGESISDIDLFFPTRIDIAKFIKDARKNLDFKLTYRGENFNRGTILHYGQRIQVDIVKRLFINEFSVVDNFDFTVCCFCISKNKIFYHPDAPFDLLSKKINIHNLPFPAGSLMRLQKYGKRGFTYCEGVIRTFMERIKESDVLVPNEFMYEDGELRANSMD